MNALSSVMAVIVGLIAGFIILLISNPSQAVPGFITIFAGGASDMFNIGMVLYYATPIMLTGLSVGFAMKTGLFNIGASGQFTFGMYAAILAGVQLTFLPGWLRCICAVLAGTLAGAIWGSIPGMLKALRNVHEVIACIMMNYIGMYIVNYLIGVTGVFDMFRNMTMRVPPEANLPTLGLGSVFSEGPRNSSVGVGIIISILVCVFIYIVLEKTRFGYELKSCGFNREAARYAGINENRSVILSMTIAGALAGLGGALIALSGTGKGISVVDVLAGEGFQGIPIALLGLSNPIGIIFSGTLIAYFMQSGFLLQPHGFAPEVIEIIVAVIIYFAALALLLKGVIEYFVREKKKTPAGAGADTGEAGDKPPDAAPREDNKPPDAARYNDDKPPDEGDPASKSDDGADTEGGDV